MRYGGIGFRVVRAGVLIAVRASARSGTIPEPHVAFRREYIPRNVDSLQGAPRAVGIFRSFNARAMPRIDVMPLACICSMFGKTLAANAAALARAASQPRCCDLARLGLPSLSPALSSPPSLPC